MFKNNRFVDAYCGRNRTAVSAIVAVALSEMTYAQFYLMQFLKQVEKLFSSLDKRVRALDLEEHDEVMWNCHMCEYRRNKRIVSMNLACWETSDWDRGETVEAMEYLLTVAKNTETMLFLYEPRAIRLANEH